MVQHKQKQKAFDILLKNGNIRGLKEEQRECGFNLEISNELNNEAPLMKCTMSYATQVKFNMVFNR